MVPREPLHTERLEEVYGPIIAQVLRHDKHIRESHLIDQRGISRTYALTFFPKKEHSPHIQVINKEIQAGMPIGKAFKAHGYEIRKNTIDLFILELPEWLRLTFSSGEKYAKVRLAEFYVKRPKEKPELYGAVFEIYSPEFRKPTITKTDISTINPSTETLNKYHVDKERIWELLGDNPKKELDDIYHKAKKETLPLIYELKNRLFTHLQQR